MLKVFSPGKLQKVIDKKYKTLSEFHRLLIRERVDVSYAGIKRWLDGSAKPSAEKLYNVAEILKKDYNSKITFDYFMVDKSKSK